MTMPRIARLIAYALLAVSAGLVQAQMVPLADVVQVTTGGSHSCALTSAGGVKCWGNNDYGQLGDNSTTGRLTPVDVTGLASGVQAISAGDYHTCALTSSGGVKCWGTNDHGQLGDNSGIGSMTPVDVIGLTNGVQAISAGKYHTCAVTGGGAKCWGANFYGQLGDNSDIGSWVPIDVTGLSSGVQAIAAGGFFTCALTGSSGVKCWGFNGQGQLGDNSTITRLMPVDVTGLASGVQAISTGSMHACAIVGGGGAMCWGANYNGQLGDNSTVNRLTPVDVTGLASGVQAISAGYGHTCALAGGGVAQCWGANYLGQLGDSTTTDRLTPVDATGLASGVQAIDAGRVHTCALTDAGRVKCWGFNHDGQLGDNSTVTRLTPVDVTGIVRRVQAISAGDFHTCALVSGGGVKCWGDNSYGQLGDGTTSDRWTPVNVAGLDSGVLAISAGFGHTCALTSKGGVRCWGLNDSGQLGDGSVTDSLTPIDVEGFTSGIQAISAGAFHACALTDGGGAKCWGSNSSGQLGDNSTTSRLTPIDVVSLAGGVHSISAGAYHTCAVTDAGGAKCWGNNVEGQVGDGTRTGEPTPQTVLVLGDLIFASGFD